MTKPMFLLAAFCSMTNLLQAQLMASKNEFTHADTLRGSITKYRQGWDVQRYDLTVTPDILQQTITGKNTITFLQSTAIDTMQIDLQQPLVVDSIVNAQHNLLAFDRRSDVCMVAAKLSAPVTGVEMKEVTIYYHGKPIAAKRAPWDGGLVWNKDKQGNPWVATACQGLGASVWWPCKDYQGDEPDKGMTITIVAPTGLAAVSNGRLQDTLSAGPGLTQWKWKVTSPINTYGVTMNIGKYAWWNDTLNGVAGTLQLQYWALQENLAKAQTQFIQAKPMLHSFEYWFGKYPFYEDSYKLVEVPFLGMEHQSAVAYGNDFKNGYRGTDLSGSGYGLKWDFIIIHESGHEWFGNNITSNDIADMWVHEGFTNYSETLFTESQFGKAAGNEYNYGTRSRIRNDIPIIGPYGVNKEGSGDMYYKGGNMLQTIRHSINNDSVFVSILRGLNSTFYHQTVTTQQVEQYISTVSGRDFAPVFNQYLRTTQVPELQYYHKRKKLFYRWANCVPGFNLSLAPGMGVNNYRLSPTTQWQSVTINKKLKEVWSPNAIEKNYYLSIKKGQL